MRLKRVGCVAKWIVSSKLAWFAALAILISLSTTVLAPKAVSALSGSDFNAGRIIDDVIFFSPSLSPDEIQVFLNSKVPVCDTNGTKPYNGGPQTRAEWAAANGKPQPPYICLKDYKQDVPATAADAYCSGAIAAGTAKSAAQIIYDVGKACEINPKVLIVLLQKEQSLVTDDWPWPVQYQKATGYGCPDTAPCDEQYYGFFNQVYNAARQSQRYGKQPERFNYRAGMTSFIGYNPNASCGGSNVNISNRATAALYNYTPYQPNQAALNNLYGTGDSCSAYGNRNFWRMFNDWFGSTYADDTFEPHPNGTLIDLGGKVYLVENGTKRWITNSHVFTSHRYGWFQVKKATTGDSKLPNGADISTLAPGTIFYTDNSPVYVVTYSGANLVKQQVSYAAFHSLGYVWSDVVYVPLANVPATTASTILDSNDHPAGTLVVGNGKVYQITLDSSTNQLTKRWIINPDAFVTNNFDWVKIKTASTADLALPDSSSSMDLRQGNMLISSGSIYVVDYDSSGIMKRPVGPWECFANRWHYAYRDLYQISAATMPTRTGPVATC